VNGTFARARYIICTTQLSSACEREPSTRTLGMIREKRVVGTDPLLSAQTFMVPAEGSEPREMMRLMGQWIAGIMASDDVHKAISTSRLCRRNGLGFTTRRVAVKVDKCVDRPRVITVNQSELGLNRSILATKIDIVSRNI
jgi:hypothetical protein